MTEVKKITRPGEHAACPGDQVRVSNAVLSSFGVEVKDRGWSRARVVRLLRSGSATYAEVTVPGRAGTRTVHADRLTRMRQAQ